MSDTSAETDRIQRDLDKTRASMGAKLEELKDRFSPGQILDDVLTQFRSSEGGAFARDLMGSIKGNPLPAALTGIGLAWLMASSPKPQNGTASVKPATPRWHSADHFDREMEALDRGQVRDEGEGELSFSQRVTGARAQALGLSKSGDESHESFAERISGAMSSARDTLMDAGQTVKDQVSSAVGMAGDSLQAAGSKIAGQVQAAPQMATDLYRTVIANPVMLGALGLAVGALLGVAIPQSNAEEEALESTASGARAAATKAAQDVVDKGSELAGKAMEAGRASADAHGIGGEATLSNIAETMKKGDLVEGVKAMAKDAVGALSGEKQDKPQQG